MAMDVKVVTTQKFVLATVLVKFRLSKYSSMQWRKVKIMFYVLRSCSSY